MNSKSILFAATAVSAALFAGCSRQERSSAEAAAASSAPSLTAAQRARLRIETIQPSTFHRSVETTGTVAFDADRSTTVLAPISGPVSRLVVSLGARVKAGDPLALVASPDYATAISAYRKAVVTENNLRRVADLDAQLFKADALARRDLEQAQTDAANATADREAALQQLHAIGVPDETIRALREGRPIGEVSGVIRSPLAGTVVEKLISPGQLLQAGTTPCFTVADLSQVWVMADIYESQLAGIAVGDSAEIVTSASPAPLPGKVENIAAILDPTTRAIAVRVVADNPGEVLKKQMYVHVRIRSQRETTGILVPSAAILRDDENLPFVYLSAKDGSIERRRVTLGSAVGDRYEITSGLAPGDQIVADGGLYVQFQQNQ